MRDFGLVSFERGECYRQHDHVENNIGQRRRTCHVINNIAKYRLNVDNAGTLKITWPN